MHTLKRNRTLNTTIQTIETYSIQKKIGIYPTIGSEN